MQIEDIANQSIDLIGYKRHIGHIYDGSPPATTVLTFWHQTVDELLTQTRPEWAKKQVVLTLVKSAPVGGYDPTTPWTSAYPPLPWRFQYGYPEDCVCDLQIHGTPNAFPVWRPRYAPYRLGNDAGTRCILSNEEGAILTYVGRAADVNLWQSDFTAAFVQILAKKIAPELMPHQQSAEQKDGGNTAS